MCAPFRETCGSTSGPVPKVRRTGGPPAAAIRHRATVLSRPEEKYRWRPSGDQEAQLSALFPSRGTARAPPGGRDDPHVALIVVRDRGAVGRERGMAPVPQAVLARVRRELLRLADVAEGRDPDGLVPCGAGPHERDALAVGRD